ncbi:glycosyltransferase [Pararoseomonas sp. SCSIO 73927]|uniref:glycosyltransferase n=1 Tax=Pararoseomonas sp. SCSIO 73927 TaxID=3114537 RepID=UPI0030D0BC22
MSEVTEGQGTTRSAGRVEVFTRHGRFLYVAGWFQAAEDDLSEEVPRLVLRWGEERRAIALRRLRERQDVAGRDGLPAGRGFQVLLDGPETDDPASATLELRGEAFPLAPALLRPTPFRPRGGLDVPGRDGVSGWTVDVPGEQPLLVLEGSRPLPVPLDVHRPDLPFEDGTEVPRFGFHISLEALAEHLRQDDPATTLFDGRSREIALVASGVELARQPVAVRRDVIGKLERTDAGQAVERARGRVEVFTRHGRFLYVAGWFQAAEDDLSEEVPRLVLRWGEERRAIALRRLRERQDVAGRDGLPAGRGFQVLLDGPETDDPASATLELRGEAFPLAPALLRPTPFRPRGGLDVPGRDGVSGWTVDVPGEQPLLVLEGSRPLPVPLDVHRPDLPFEDGTEVPRFGFHISLEALAEHLRQDDPATTLFDGWSREIALVASGVELARQPVAVRRDMIGKLERTDAGQAVGWVAERGRPQDEHAVDLLLGGTRWTTVQADIERPDLIRPGVVRRGGGFRAALPPAHPGEGGPLRVEAVPLHGTEALPGGTVLEALPAWRRDFGEVAFRVPDDGRVPVSVVIPIYNAAAELARCIDSVVRHTTGAARLILIDDASPQPEVAEVLERWSGTPGIEIHRNASNLGFTRTANRGIALAGRDDVVLLNSDTAVGPGWLEGLRAAARSGPRTGTATAVSNNAGAFSVPEFNLDNPMPAWFGVDDMARLVRGAALPLLPVVPTGHGFCLYIRRECLDAVGAFDETAFPRGYGEENDFCMRAARAGFDNVLDDRTFVWHLRSASFGSEKVALNAQGRAVLEDRYPEYGFLTRMFQADPAMLALRWRVRRAVQQALAEGVVPRPRVLFVISTESGGTPQTNRDLMDALSDRYEPWLLRCDSRTLTLSRYAGARSGEADTVIESITLERAIEPATHRSAEYDRHAANLVLRHGFELVHIRHIAWHGLGLPQVCQRLGVPVVLSFHDFYMACPVTKLLDAEGRFCGGPCTDGETDCTAELWSVGSVPPLRHRFVHRWQAMMSETILACDGFVTTSPSARETVLRNFPDLAQRDFRVIPHGRSFHRQEMLAAEPNLDERLRVLVPGNISAAKGSELIAAMAALDGGREVEFHVLGAVDRHLAEAPGIVLHGRYDREEFAARVGGIRPHLAAILSLWPETYCHTLTECWAVGLPVVATLEGALAERIGASGGGWLLDRWMAPEAMLSELLRLRREPTEVRGQRDAVLDWQATIGRHRTTAAMAAEYDRLYREVLDRRRSFAVAAEAPRIVLTLDRATATLPTPLAVATRNAVSRTSIFRPILPSFPFGNALAGMADAVLVSPDALPPGDLEALRRRCAAAGLPVLEVACGREAGDGLEVGSGLEAARWLSDMPPAPEKVASDEGAACRVLFVSTGDETMVAALRPAFEDLSALDVATLGILGGRPGNAQWYKAILTEGKDPVAVLRRVAAAHDIGLAPPGPTLLAMEAAGLPVLQLPDFRTGDAEFLHDWLLRQVAEFAVNAARQADAARAGAAKARAAILHRSDIAALDRRLAQAFRGAGNSSPDPLITR